VERRALTENEVMGRAAVANEHHRLRIGGLPDLTEQRRQAEEHIRDQALERAKSAGLNAYPVAGLDGVFCVPSGSRLGWVYEVRLLLGSGQPWACTCESRVRWCRHAAAAWKWWADMKADEDSERQHEATERVIAMKGND
jgi:hypothetical protein